MANLKINDWIKSGLILALMSAIFSLNAIAQDKPLDSQQLANLVAGLKGALQENLAILESKNGKQYQAVTRKWDARRDLTGKSKSQVIDLLYQDVASEVKDSGMKYQISQVFSFYERMPDSQFSAKENANNSSNVSAETKFTDPRDGEVYEVKRLGNLTWMKENLRFAILSASWCFDNDDENCAELGRLYTFPAALKACPSGWRLPSDHDWLDLETALGLSQEQRLIDNYNAVRGNNVGEKLKVGGESGLDFKISGFASISNGKAEFDGIDDDRPRAYFWTSTSKNVNNQTIAVRRRVEEAKGSIFRFSNPANGYAISVRCVK